MTVREEVQRQHECDLNWPSHAPEVLLVARLRALGEARKAHDLEESEVARQAWRSVKRGSVGLSFGFLVERDRKATDGVRELLSVDLFEVSITPSPANADTRILSTKSSVLTAQEHHDQELLKILQRPFVPDPVDEKTAKPKSTEPMTVARFEVG